MNKKTLDEFARYKKAYEKSIELNTVIRRRPETAVAETTTARMVLETLRFSRDLKKRMKELEPEVRAWIAGQSDPEVRAALHLMYIDGKSMTEACKKAHTRTKPETLEERCQRVLASIKR